MDVELHQQKSSIITMPLYDAQPPATRTGIQDSLTYAIQVCVHRQQGIPSESKRPLVFESSWPACYHPVCALNVNVRRDVLNLLDRVQNFTPSAATAV